MIELVDVLAATNNLPERVRELRPWLNAEEQTLAELILANPSYIGPLYEAPDFANHIKAHCTPQAWAEVLRVWAVRVATQQLGEAIHTLSKGNSADDVLNVLASLRTQYADASRAHIVHDFKELFEVAAETLPEMALGPFARQLGLFPVEVGNLIVLGARPGVGKTAAALRIALERAAKGYRTHYVSLEMTSQQLAARFRSLITQSPLQSPIDCDPDDIRAISVDLQDLITVHHFSGTLNALKDAVEPYVTDGDLLVIDHAHLIQVGMQSRVEAYSEVTRYFKGFSRMRNATTLLLGQLRRDSDNGVPGLGDLSWSASFEQDADLVALLYEDASGVTMSKIAKSRQGEQGIASLDYDWQYRLLLPDDWTNEPYLLAPSH